MFQARAQERVPFCSLLTGPRRRRSAACRQPQHPLCAGSSPDGLYYSQQTTAAIRNFAPSGGMSRAGSPPRTRRVAGLSDHVFSHQTGYRRRQPQRIYPASAADRPLRPERPEARTPLARPAHSAGRHWACGGRRRTTLMYGSIAGRCITMRPPTRQKSMLSHFSFDLTLWPKRKPLMLNGDSGFSRKGPERSRPATTTACRI